MTETLEYKILKYLSENDNGEYVDLSFIDSNEILLKSKLIELKKNKFIQEKCDSTFIGTLRVLKDPKYKILIKGSVFLQQNETKSTIIAENYIGGNNHGTQSSKDFSNSSITNNTIANPNNELKKNSKILKFWKLISENKLISSLLLVIILWAIKEVFNINLKV